MAMVDIRAPRSTAAWSGTDDNSNGSGGAVIDAIRNRRSLSPRHLMAPGPDAGEIRQIVDAAAAAPDHGLLRPTRFVHVCESSRGLLSDVFEAALLERRPDAGARCRVRAREKARNGAVLLALVARITPGHSEVPESEQWIAVGAALQNALLAAEDLGYRAKIVSGAVARSRTLNRAFNLGENENMVGFVAIGTPGRAAAERRTERSQGLLTTW